MAKGSEQVPTWTDADGKTYELRAFGVRAKLRITRDGQVIASASEGPWVIRQTFLPGANDWANVYLVKPEWFARGSLSPE